MKWKIKINKTKLTHVKCTLFEKDCPALQLNYEEMPKSDVRTILANTLEPKASGL